MITLIIIGIVCCGLGMMIGSAWTKHDYEFAICCGYVVLADHSEYTTRPVEVEDPRAKKGSSLTSEDK